MFKLLIAIIMDTIANPLLFSVLLVYNFFVICYVQKFSDASLITIGLCTSLSLIMILISYLKQLLKSKGLNFWLFFFFQKSFVVYCLLNVIGFILILVLLYFDSLLAFTKPLNTVSIASNCDIVSLQPNVNDLINNTELQKPNSVYDILRKYVMSNPTYKKNDVKFHHFAPYTLEEIVYLLRKQNNGRMPSVGITQSIECEYAFTKHWGDPTNVLYVTARTISPTGRVHLFSQEFFGAEYPNGDLHVTAGPHHYNIINGPFSEFRLQYTDLNYFAPDSSVLITTGDFVRR